MFKSGGVISGGIAIALLLAPSAGRARPTVEIVSPRANTCVNNGGELFTGGVPGGEIAPLPRDVPLVLRLAETEGQQLTLRFEVDGELVYEAQFMPAAAGVAEETDFYVIPAEDIEDGDGRRLRVVATNEDGESDSANVAFRLDRAVPRITFSEETLGTLGSCFPDGAPPLDYEVADDLDPAPRVAERSEVEGCELRRFIRVEDACGNAQEMVFATIQPPPEPGAISIRFFGLNEGDRVGRASLGYEVEMPNQCDLETRSDISRDGGEFEVWVSGEEIDEPGDYVARVTVVACGGEEIVAERRFTVLRRPVAEAGGPYEGRQGERIRIDGSQSFAPEEIGGIVEWGWDLNGDGFFDPEEGDGPITHFDGSIGDGQYRVFLRIRAGNDAVEFDHADVTVLDIDPVCDAGGPYEVQEGQQLQLDGSASRPGHESDPILTWDWEFGDRQFPQRAGDLPRPFHTYADQGEYMVRLRVEDPDSHCEDTAVVVVSDVDPIIAGIGALNADGLIEGEPVTFTAGTSGPGSVSDPIAAFVWDFGVPDGTEEGPFLRNPTFTYDDDGEYEVCLTLRDPDSEVRECFDITVVDLVPMATFTGPRLGVEGEELFFDATGSTAGGAADPVRAYVWDFGDGTGEVRVEDPEQFVVGHVFPRQGEFTVRLFVEDEDSRSPAFEQTVTISDVIPVARARVVLPEGREVALEGQEIELDASESAPGSPTDPIAAYRWDFGDGTDPVEGADLARVQHAFPDQGTFRVRLTVTDSDGSSVSTEVPVAVENVDPTVEIVQVSPDVEIGVPAEFRAEVVDAYGDVPQVTWDMGDGSEPLEGEVVQHTYQALGEYEIVVQVDDGDGGIARATLRVQVNLASPVIDAPEQVEGREGEPLEIRATVRSARLEGGRFDGPVQVVAANLPPGATSEVVDGEPADQLRTVVIRWTPGYVDAGRYTIRISALAPSGSTRARDVRVDISERGRPLLAAAGGTGSRGVVTLYEYGRDPLRQVETFTPRVELVVGAGAGGLAVSPDGRWLFVAVPGSGRVAVVRTAGDRPEVVRRIPTGPGTAALAWGDDRLWAAVAGTDEIVAIDPVRLKVVGRASVAPVEGPIDLVWLPEGFGELEGPARLAVIGQRSGHVALVDPAAVMAGEDAVTASLVVGGRPQRLVADPSTGWLGVADAKTRRLVQVAAADVAAEADDPQVNGVPVVFAAVDLAAREGTLWAATPGGLVQVGADGEATVHAELTATAVAPLDARIRGGGGLVIATGDEIANLVGEALSRQLTAPGGRVRRLAAFVAVE